MCLALFLKGCSQDDRSVGPSGRVDIPLILFIVQHLPRTLLPDPNPSRSPKKPQPCPNATYRHPLFPLGWGFFVFPAVRCGDEHSKNRGRSRLSCTSCLRLRSPRPLLPPLRKEFQRAASIPSPVAATASGRADDLPDGNHLFRCRRGKWEGAGQAAKTVVRKGSPRDRGLPLQRGRGRARRPRECCRFLSPVLRRWQRLCDHR